MHARTRPQTATAGSDFLKRRGARRARVAISPLLPLIAPLGGALISAVIAFLVSWVMSEPEGC